MFYFWMGLIVILGLFSYCCFLLFKKRKEPLLTDWVDWLKDKSTYILIALGVILLSYLWVLKTPLWKTVGCQYDGSTHNVETKYDWIREICYFKTKSGTWMPLIMGRDSAEDKTHDQIPDTQEQNQ